MYIGNVTVICWSKARQTHRRCSNISAYIHKAASSEPMLFTMNQFAISTVDVQNEVLSFNRCPVSTAQCGLVHRPCSLSHVCIALYLVKLTETFRNIKFTATNWKNCQVLPSHCVSFTGPKGSFYITTSPKWTATVM